MFYKIFLSPKVKRWVIITYKHGIYELNHQLPNYLRRTILGNQEIGGKCLNLKNDSLVSRPPSKIRIFLVLARKSRKIAIKVFPWCHIFNENQSSLQYFVTDCPRKIFLAPNSSQTSSNLTSFENLVSQKLPTLF